MEIKTLKTQVWSKLKRNYFMQGQLDSYTSTNFDLTTFA